MWPPDATAPVPAPPASRLPVHRSSSGGVCWRDRHGHGCRGRAGFEPNVPHRLCADPSVRSRRRWRRRREHRLRGCGADVGWRGSPVDRGGTSYGHRHLGGTSRPADSLASRCGGARGRLGEARSACSGRPLDRQWCQERPPGVRLEGRRTRRARRAAQVCVERAVTGRVTVPAPEPPTAFHRSPSGASWRRLTPHHAYDIARP